MAISERDIHRYLLWAIILVHFLGLFVDVMDVDASQYASIAMEMNQNNQWLQVHHRADNYLDKPPLVFWLSAISYKLFGINNFAYKFPSFLFALLGIFSTYRLGRLFYGRRAGRISALVLASAQALFSITLDVRTDTILLGAVIFSIWQLTAYLRYGRSKNFVLGFIGIGLAMLAKGPIGLMVPVLAIGSDMVWKRQWKKIFQWQWLLGILIVGIVLLPMMIGLYLQYDANPQAEVNGRVGQSGLYFYFWEQSFGRITGENVWKDESGPFYFIHTTLWAFLPWTVFLFLGLYQKGRHFAQVLLGRSKEPLTEVLTLGGFLLPFLALSTSHFKLPHYIFVIFPLGAIMVGHYLDKLSPKPVKYLKIIQGVLLIGTWVAAFILLFHIFTDASWVTIIVSILLFGLAFWAFLRIKSVKSIIMATCITAIGTNFVLSTHVYPSLLTYQSSSQVGKWLRSHPQEAQQFCSFNTHMHGVDFYGRKITPKKFYVHELTTDDQYLYVNETGIEKLKNANIEYDVVLEFEHFGVTNLTIDFLNPNTRQNATGTRYLIKRKNHE